jgi:ubiquinone/menaquinone biosynthesis C-methylase UbiE
MPLERTPINHLDAEPEDPRYEDSIHALELVADYYEWISSFLGLNTSSPYIATPQDIESKRKEMQKSKETRGYERGRDVYQLAMLLNSTVKETEGEFASQTVLDIGCGVGKFGEAIARNAKAKVTFLDSDQSMLDFVSPKLGERKLGDGRKLDFSDDRFDKVITAFSSVYWAVTPVESVQALNEAIRVTETGGSTLLLPLLSNTAETRSTATALAHAQQDVDMTVPFLEQRVAHDKVTAAQGYALIRSLLNLSENGFVAITWIDHKGTNANGNEADHISVIIDKLQQTPPEVLEANLAYANRFMPPGTAASAHEIE